MEDTKDFQVKSVKIKKKGMFFFIILTITGKFSSDPEMCRGILPSPYIKHPALKEMKFNKIRILNNYSFHSFVFKCPSEVLKDNIDVYETKCT